MAAKDVIFRLSKEVPSLTQEYLEYTPVSGSDIDVVVIKAEANYTQVSATKVIWDFGGAEEEVLWSIKGSGEFSEIMLIPKEKVDGVKKLALVAENGELVDMVMSMYMKIRVNENE